MISELLGNCGEGKRGQWDSFLISLSDQYSLFESRRYLDVLSVLSLVKDKHFQEQGYMENQDTFLSAAMELSCSRMFLHVGSRELSSSFLWCTVDVTQKGRAGKGIYCSLNAPSRKQGAELGESFSNSLVLPC